MFLPCFECRIKVPPVPSEGVSLNAGNLVCVSPHYFRETRCQPAPVKSCSMVTDQPGCHSDMIYVTVGDYSVIYQRCFGWVLRWLGGCQTIVHEDFRSTLILYHATHIAYLPSTPKEMESYTGINRLLWVRAGPACSIQHGSL